MIFDFIEFFGYGHFLVIFLHIMDQKMTRAKKVIRVKNQFFHACQPHKRIFEIRSKLGLIFTTVCLSFEFLV